MVLNLKKLTEFKENANWARSFQSIQVRRNHFRSENHQKRKGAILSIYYEIIWMVQALTKITNDGTL